MEHLSTAKIDKIETKEWTMFDRRIFLLET
jgi:hypothetical protein